MIDCATSSVTAAQKTGRHAHRLHGGQLGKAMGLDPPEIALTEAKACSRL